MIGKQIEEENEKAENFLERKNHYIQLLEQKIDERFNQEAQIREEIIVCKIYIPFIFFNSLLNFFQLFCASLVLTGSYSLFILYFIAGVLLLLS